MYKRDMGLLIPMLPPSRPARWIVLALWLMVFTAIPFWFQLDASAWDVAVYRSAIDAVQRGQDPYADAIATQRAYRHHGTAQPGATSAPPPRIITSILRSPSPCSESSENCL